MAISKAERDLCKKLVSRTSKMNNCKGVTLGGKRKKR